MKRLLGIAMAATFFVACSLDTRATGLFNDFPDGEAGQAGNSGAGGTIEDGGWPDSSAGQGGVSGQAGASGTGGNSGTAGQAGAGGVAGSAGQAGASGSAGQGGVAGQGGTAGQAGASGSAGAAGSGGSPTCSSSNPNTPQSVTISSTGTMGAEFMPLSGPDQYSQSSPSPITLAGHPYPAEVVQVASNDVNLNFSYQNDAGTIVFPTFYFFQPSALKYSECQGSGNIYSHNCLKAVVYDFRCQMLGKTTNCPSQPATFTAQGSSDKYSASGSGIHGVLALISCP